MSWIFRILWFWFTQRTEHALIDKAKSEGVAVYLKVLQGSRRLIVLAVLCICILQLATIAFAGAVVCAVLLSDYDMRLKLQILLGISGVLFLLPVFAFLLLTSEAVWYKFSGAERMMEELLEPSQNKKS